MNNKNTVVDFRPKVESGSIAQHMKAVLAALGEDPERRRSFAGSRRSQDGPDRMHGYRVRAHRDCGVRNHRDRDVRGLYKLPMFLRRLH